MMLACYEGALPRQILKELVRQGMISDVTEKSIGPASVDLTLSDVCYRVSEFPILAQGERIQDLVNAREWCTPHNLSDPLEVGRTYLAKLNQRLRLPDSVYGFSNPRSKSGRHDLLVRMLADGVPCFDSATPGGYIGDLWVLVSPSSFPVIIPPGEAVNQLRLFNRDTRLSRKEIKREYTKKIPLLYDHAGEQIPFDSLHQGIGEGDSLILTLELDGDIAGWECRGTEKILDYRRGKGFYKSHVSQFFTPIPSTKEMELRPDSFYILTTREHVLVPPWLACEMVAMDERYGEFRSHYAGYIDPGWGFGQNGEVHGRQLTLEVRPFGRPMVLRNHQPIARIKFERVAGVPDMHYDSAEKGSDFKGQQGPQLSSYFFPR